ncbi:MAG: YheE family protein [Bacillaceae bacterium]|nr:YheE family protein [Bacillaceae bacterium]
MISHFQWKELRNNLVRQEWEFSFFYKGEYFLGVYYQDGSISWSDPAPKEEERKQLELQVHDLFLYHVYEEH